MRYFFHLVDGTRILDPLGQLYGSDKEAILHGRQSARQFAKVHPSRAPWASVMIVEASGRLVAVVPCAQEDASASAEQISGEPTLTGIEAQPPVS